MPKFYSKKNFVPSEYTLMPVVIGKTISAIPYVIPDDYQLIVKVQNIGYGSISVIDSFYSSISVGDLVYISYSTGRFSKSLYLWNIWQ